MPTVPNLSSMDISQDRPLDGLCLEEHIMTMARFPLVQGVVLQNLYPKLYLFLLVGSIGCNIPSLKYQEFLHHLFL